MTTVTLWLILFLPADNVADRSPHFVSYSTSHSQCLTDAQTVQQVADLDGKKHGIAVCMSGTFRMGMPKK